MTAKVIYGSIRRFLYYFEHGNRISMFLMSARKISEWISPRRYLSCFKEVLMLFYTTDPTHIRSSHILHPPVWLLIPKCLYWIFRPAIPAPGQLLSPNLTQQISAWYLEQFFKFYAIHHTLPQSCCTLSFFSGAPVTLKISSSTQSAYLPCARSWFFSSTRLCSRIVLSWLSR